MGKKKGDTPNSDNPKLDKLFQVTIADNIARFELLDNNIMYMPTAGHWINEFFSVYYQVFIADQYEASRIKEGDIVFDCGAHIGSFALKACQQGAKCVYAFEPLRANIACLEKLMRLNYPINIIPSAAWSENGYLQFQLELSEGSGRCFVSESTEDTTYEVTAFSIDSIVEEFKVPRVDFIKMDIEGSEREALSGATETIKKWKPKLAISAYHREGDTQVLPGLISSMRPDYEIKIVNINWLCETVLIAN